MKTNINVQLFKGEKVVVITSGINCFEIIKENGEKMDGNVIHRQHIREKAIAKLKAHIWK